MLDLEKLQENSQEVGEKFAHLVTFNNTFGFNGRTTRLSLPKRFSKKIASFNSEARIKFNEDTIRITFIYKPNDETFRVLSDFSNEVKKNKKFLNCFKKSDDVIRLQIFPKSHLDGSLVSWYNVKLTKIENRFTETKKENMMETILTFSFSKTDYKYSSPAMYNSRETIERSRQVYEDFINKNLNDKELEDKWEKQRDLMNKELNSNWMCGHFKKEQELIEELETHAKICKTDESQKSENESAQ